MWSIVFDPKELRVYFRTKWNAHIRHIDFSPLDFSCSTQVQMLDVHSELSGDVGDDLVRYSHEVSLDHLVNVLGKLGFDASRNDMEGLLQQIEDYSCAEGGENVARVLSRVFPAWIWLVAAGLLVIVPLAVWYGTRRRVERN
jgi:hypothetical protein